MNDVLINNIDDEIIKKFVILLSDSINVNEIMFINIITNLIKHDKKIDKQIIYDIFKKYNFDNLKTKYIQIENEIKNIIHHHVENTIYKKYIELLHNNNIICNSLVYSGIVIVKNNDYTTMKPIVITDGSKCIVKNNKINNKTINDTHAEVLVKKGFIYYLINQIELCYNNNESIFIKKNDESELLILKDNIQFHLYISKLPCGSFNRLIYNNGTNYKKEYIHNNKSSYTDLNNILKNDKKVLEILSQIKNKINELLNSNTNKIKIPYYYDISSVNTINKTMSCSDKIIKWILLGIQGSILSSIIKPIFLNSIVIGTGTCYDFKFKNYDNMKAKKIFDLLKDRLEKFDNNIMIPDIVCTDKIYPSILIINRPTYSLNWIYNNNVEIINSFTGLINNTGEISKLSKFKLIDKLTNVKLFVMYKKLFEKNHKLFNINKLLLNNYSNILNGINIEISEEEQIFFKIYNIKNESEYDVYEINKINFLINLFV
jgi:hypothetical protein